MRGMFPFLGGKMFKYSGIEVGEILVILTVVRYLRKIAIVVMGVGWERSK